MEDRACATCCWNSKNDFFEPDIVIEPTRAFTQEVCVSGVPGYPNRCNCEFWADEPEVHE